MIKIYEYLENFFFSTLTIPFRSYFNNFEINYICNFILDFRIILFNIRVHANMNKHS